MKGIGRHGKPKRFKPGAMKDIYAESSLGPNGPWQRLRIGQVPFRYVRTMVMFEPIRVEAELL